MVDRPVDEPTRYVVTPGVAIHIVEREVALRADVKLVAPTDAWRPVNSALTQLQADALVTTDADLAAMAASW